MTLWFDNNLSMKNTAFGIQNPSFLYQDLTPCDELIENVYRENDIYAVESSKSQLNFKVKNLLEAYDCINDISKACKKYSKCWHLYNKIRESIAKENEKYEWYSIYVSNYDDKNGEWIIKLLKL